MSGPLPTSTTGSAVTVSSNDVDIGDSECRQVNTLNTRLSLVNTLLILATHWSIHCVLMGQDYVSIPGGWGGTDINNALYDRDRFCGQALGYCLEDTCNTREVGAVR